ncbi:hypothetical protein SCP_1601990 [Sparassis crispa]|uniref:Uncharacterized protein n=1 Tax=Sparassis crispa TaxID=139825 RepID=A0A401H521_9APHY|nr:hypothetical protein SCP_1601990 [Sparassis crispa]GBE89537.1 hypothetical protein SCP_1601990 [Sparassis crispa]
MPRPCFCHACASSTAYKTTLAVQASQSQFSPPHQAYLIDIMSANDKLFKDLQQSKSPWSATPTVNATNSGGFAHVTVEREVGKNTSVGGHVGYEWAGPTPTRQYGAPYGGVHIKYRF